jgi:hypothetical protein
MMVCLADVGVKVNRTALLCKKSGGEKASQGPPLQQKKEMPGSPRGERGRGPRKPGQSPALRGEKEGTA